MSTAATLPLDVFIKQLDELANAAVLAFSNAGDADALEAMRVEFLGAKNGKLKIVQKSLGQIGQADKPAAGQKLNQVKDAIHQAFEAATTRLSSSGTAQQFDPKFDPTLPGEPVYIGRLHPITQTINELKDIMGRLGFTAADGPEIEDDWHNFEALNIPLAHPARDPLDNFYLSVGRQVAPQNDSQALLMRSQTSTVQIRVMEKTQPPIRIISLGRVYRPDTADGTHFPMFHQMEGLLVDREVNMSDEVPIRVRPSFFPFTEPSVEADYFWNGKWTEFGGAGIVDPNVIRAVGYDPEQVSGFAFGLGVERLCMIRHKITDIRSLFTNDVRFLHQF
jgi:phenylalanyl-tRNA synthetase alpha chain